MKKLLFLSLSIWFSASALMAQKESASSGAVRFGDAIVPVTLGQSVVTLYGPWKFHVGDNPRWADPNFDDSHWETVDLTPTPQTTVPGVPIPGFVTGWEARGHPGYAGYAWYRIRVRISGSGGPLTMLSPEWFDGAFQVFANGRLVGSFGKFTGLAPELYYSNPAMISLPASESRPGPDGNTLIAFRFYVPAASLGHGAQGGMHGPPRIGLPAAATAVFHMEWEREYRRQASLLAAALLYLFFALLIAMMFAFSRSDKVLLWPLSASIFEVIQFALMFSRSAQWLSQLDLEALIALASVLGGYLWVLTWQAYFGLQRTRWLLNAILALGAYNLAAIEFFNFALQTGKAPPALLFARQINSVIMGSTVFLVTLTIAYLGWKHTERRQWFLLFALLFFSSQVFAPELGLLHLRTSWQPFGVLIPLGLISDCASLFCFSVVLFRQLRTSLKRQQATEEDLKQAQEIQSLLIPHQAPEVPGWRIESEYRPARQVGGDFFQVLPGSDGSLLIVVGDVSGKGLQAAMTVSAIVGGLRGCTLRAPTEVLAYLNGILHGQIGGFVTCATALICEDGALTIANAGHLPPYRNGEELVVPSGLPLGMLAEASYEEQRHELAPGDRLTFVSDGVVEARNTKGELLGFERLAKLTAKHAAEIAETAHRWGQEDDITVLTVARAPKLEVVTV